MMESNLKNLIKSSLKNIDCANKEDECLRRFEKNDVRRVYQLSYLTKEDWDKIDLSIGVRVAIQYQLSAMMQQQW